MNSFVVKGLFIDTPDRETLRCRDGYVLCEDGCFAGFSEQLPESWTAVPVNDYTGKLLLPGFCDLHLHAPQYANMGLGMDVQLLEWLDRYTYPEESRYANPDYAQKQYAAFVQDLKHTPTTRCSIFGTIHTDSTLVLMRLLDDAGFHGYVGKLNMDRNSPDYYREKSVADGIRETRRWIEASSGFSGIHPILTPRFTPSVTDHYMAEIGKLAEEYRLPFQSHLSENPAEIAWVRELCPNRLHYADTYDHYGLFGGDRPTVMAHCIYCTDEEKKLIRDQNVMIAHCPTSNSNVVAGIAPAAEFLRNGYEIGFGSDISGGHTLNLFEVMRTAIECSKLRWLYIDRQYAPLNMTECLWMATVGGGRFFETAGTKTGLFEEGYALDLIAMDDSAITGDEHFTPAQRLERYTYLGNGHPSAKYINGQEILL